MAITKAQEMRLRAAADTGRRAGKRTRALFTQKLAMFGGAFLGQRMFGDTTVPVINAPANLVAGGVGALLTISGKADKTMGGRMASDFLLGMFAGQLGVMGRRARDEMAIEGDE